MKTLFSYLEFTVTYFAQSVAIWLLFVFSETDSGKGYFWHTINSDPSVDCIVKIDIKTKLIKLP